MAEQLAEFQTLSPPREGLSKYPWADWLNGEPWLLEAGQDYNCLANSLVSAAVKYAQRHGFSVRSSVAEDGLAVTIQAVQKRPKRLKG